MRNLSLDGLKKISAGQNGEVYRLNEEQILKVYNPWSISIEKIRREKESAKRAFIQGIPTAISFDIVTVGDRYGLVYEMFKARTMGEKIRRKPYVLIRGLAGVTYSGMVKEEQRKEYITRMNEAFLKGVEKYRVNPLIEMF